MCSQKNCGSKRNGQRTCLLRWRTAQQHCLLRSAATASASADNVWCTSTTPARRELAAGAACDCVEIASRLQLMLLAIERCEAARHPEIQASPRRWSSQARPLTPGGGITWSVREPDRDLP